MNEQGIKDKAKVCESEGVESEMEEDVSKRIKRYNCTGKLIAKQVAGIVVDCPHEGCGAGITTILYENIQNTGQERITWTPEMILAYSAGKSIILKCRKCGSVLEVRRPLIQRINQGPNRQQKQAMRKKIKVVKS